MWKRRTAVLVTHADEEDTALLEGRRDVKTREKDSGLLFGNFSVEPDKALAKLVVGECFLSEMLRNVFQETIPSRNRRKYL